MKTVVLSQTVQSKLQQIKDQIIALQQRKEKLMIEQHNIDTNLKLATRSIEMLLVGVAEGTDGISLDTHDVKLSDDKGSIIITKKD